MLQSTPAPQSPSSAVAKPLLILVDGHSLAFRSYFAFAKGRDGGLRTTTGIPTNVCFGFLKSLVEVMSAEQPQSMAVAFDTKEPTFRHEADKTYKAGREETPEEFIPDLKNLQELLVGLRVTVLRAPGFEADDVLATLAHRASNAGYQVKIVTGDRDLFQLVDPNKGITVLYLSSSFWRRSSDTGPVEFNTEDVVAKLGITPAQVVDYKALCGDKSDNIPGVKGIGDKTAVKLLKEYGTLEEIYASLDKMKGSVKQKLETGEAEAKHSQYLAQLRFDAPAEIELEDTKLQGFDLGVIKPLLAKLELKLFLDKIDQLQEQFGGVVVEEAAAESVEVVVPDREDEDLWFFSAEDTEAYQQEQLANIPFQARIINTEAKLTELVQQLQNCTNPNFPVAWDTETSALEPRDAQLVGIGCCFFKQKAEEKAEGRRQKAEEKAGGRRQEAGGKKEEKAEGSSAKPLPQAGQRAEGRKEGKEGGKEEEEDNCLSEIEITGGEEIQSYDVEVAYIPIAHQRGVNLDRDLVLEALRPILESTDYPKALQNSKFDRLVLRSQGIQLAGVVFDTMLASYVLNPDNSHNLGELALKYLGLTAKSYTELVPKGKTIGEVDIPAVADYCGMDVYTTFMIVVKLREEFRNVPQLQQLLLEVELPLEPVLAEMEYQGICIDQPYLKNFSQQLEKDLLELEEQAYQDAGEKFNLGSPKQLSELLFVKLELDRKKSRKIKTGYSTDAATLEKLRGDHLVVDGILEYRSLAKLKSTYVDALPALVRSDSQRVHTDFNQAVTTTGRLSSSNPNLQNIPIRTAFSRQIRKAFIPESGWLLVAADYSQIELRILAHLSKEPVLVKAYQTKGDVHTLTAQMLFDKEEVTTEERRLGKVINFGVIYGMGAQRFAREAKMPAAQGKIFIDRFNQRYPQIFAYLEQMKQEAIAQGYVETILGRRRYFNFTSEKLRRLQGKDLAEINLEQLKGLGAYDAGLLRAAANSPIQGSSADIIKVAMVKLHEILHNYQARLLLQVHDELVFEVPPEEWEELQPKIREAMESAVELTVPLMV
ncbi:MAG: DNA polymerase I, partial [Symploca sp. SIO1B1]|nr:DNA polymerase I [Symploca sp. SIO1B1]